MFKILAIFGATGKQEISIIDHVLNDSELSRQYKIRAITRDFTSAKAKLLQDKVEVVHGAILNRPSVETALTGVHAVFIMTASFLSPDVEGQISSSALPSIYELSGGKYVKVTGFDIKAKAEQYIWGLPVPSAFCSLGSFVENFESYSYLTPRKEEDVNSVRDTGKFVGAILAEPDKFDGKTLCDATKLYSLQEMIAIVSKATGKDITYKHISPDEFRKRLKLPDSVVDMFMEMITFLDETEYFGPNTENLVAWSANNARGKLSTLEEYLEAHPLRLE
ncbi:putative hscarg dehydrogenase [Karstenula rhodostoma CBS 690.94]|uniref:Hscarg dehydrogenase n=1 Tax=Karstenula rhodostoma CBS 690.94 TaxID=1392251 RepID=A0A9P4UG88_9PLEO|nr:putative hscarg dehydrogenase [Karstenula rhodostoma CBS 690.94]